MSEFRNVSKRPCSVLGGCKEEGGLFIWLGPSASLFEICKPSESRNLSVFTTTPILLVQRLGGLKGEGVEAIVSQELKKGFKFVSV